MRALASDYLVKDWQASKTPIFYMAIKLLSQQSLGNALTPFIRHSGKAERSKTIREELTARRRPQNSAAECRDSLCEKQNRPGRIQVTAKMGDKSGQRMTLPPPLKSRDGAAPPARNIAL
jgi:hypothetical protein